MSERKPRQLVPNKITLLAGVAAVALIAAGSLPGGPLIPTARGQQASVSVSSEFHQALDRYGEWRRHPRWN